MFLVNTIVSDNFPAKMMSNVLCSTDDFRLLCFESTPGAWSAFNEFAINESGPTVGNPCFALRSIAKYVQIV